MFGKFSTSKNIFDLDKNNFKFSLDQYFLIRQKTKYPEIERASIYNDLLFGIADEEFGIFFNHSHTLRGTRFVKLAISEAGTLGLSHSLVKLHNLR